MSIKTHTRIGMAAAMAVFLGACQSPTGATAPTTSAVANVTADTSIEFDIETITCWEVLSAPQEATEYALTLLYGYAAGKADTRVHSGDLIESRASKAGDTCAENPDMPAYQAFN